MRMHMRMQPSTHTHAQMHAQMQMQTHAHPHTHANAHLQLTMQLQMQLKLWVVAQLCMAVAGNLAKDWATSDHGHMVVRCAGEAQTPTRPWGVALALRSTRGGIGGDLETAAQVLLVCCAQSPQ